MYNLPTEPRKIQERIRRYERAFIKEQQEFGAISDGAGKRYLLGPLYLILNDIDGALKYSQWFESTFPDDGLQNMFALDRTCLYHILGKSVS